MVLFLTDLYTFDGLVIVTKCTTHTGMSIVVFYMRQEDMCLVCTNLLLIYLLTTTFYFMTYKVYMG